MITHNGNTNRYKWYAYIHKDNNNISEYTYIPIFSACQANSAKGIKKRIRKIGLILNPPECDILPLGESQRKFDPCLWIDNVLYHFTIQNIEIIFNKINYSF